MYGEKFRVERHEKNVLNRRLQSGWHGTGKRVRARYRRYLKSAVLDVNHLIPYAFHPKITHERKALVSKLEHR